MSSAKNRQQVAVVTGASSGLELGVTRPCRVEVPEAEPAELRRRITATKWPERETVADASQGVQLATIQALVRYWGTDYDWRKIEAKLNSLPQFMTEIDGLDIHSIHVRSKHDHALSLIIRTDGPARSSSGSLLPVHRPTPRHMALAPTAQQEKKYENLDGLNLA